MRIIQGVFNVVNSGYKIEAHKDGGYRVVNRQGRTVRHFATRTQAQRFVTKRNKPTSPVKK